MMKEIIFGIARIGLIATLAYGQCRSSSRIDALEARVADMAAHLEAKPAEGRDDAAALREVALVLAGRVRADDKRHDAQGARAVVLDDKDGRAPAGQLSDDEADMRRMALPDPLKDFVADPEGGDGGKGERECFKGVHGGHYTK
jgi:hypothetical protein